MVDDKASNKVNPHEGHRSRMKQKFIKNGLNSFEEHEMLEFLLFYSIPRKNTNLIAHELIDQFGNIANVLDANIELLQEVNGINENSAILLKMIPKLCNVYANCNTPSFSFNDEKDLRQFAINQYLGETSEILKAVYLNSDNSYITCNDICTIHNSNAIAINFKKIIERAEKYNASHIILMHNHPNGSPKPSDDDIYATKKIDKILHNLGMLLVDHVIVSKNDTLSMRGTGYLAFN